jgi:hypothetical protein
MRAINVAAGASPFATYGCIDTWLADFRGDLPRIDVLCSFCTAPRNRILRLDSTAVRLPALISDCTLVSVEDAPHKISLTYQRGERRAARAHRREVPCTDHEAQPRPTDRQASPILSTERCG